jgi:hypothetical protein
VLAGAPETIAGDHSRRGRLTHQRSVDIDDDPALRNAGTGFEPELLVGGVEHEQALVRRRRTAAGASEQEAQKIAIAGLVPLAAELLAAMGGLSETLQRLTTWRFLRSSTCWSFLAWKAHRRRGQ